MAAKSNTPAGLCCALLATTQRCLGRQKIFPKSQKNNKPNMRHRSGMRKLNATVQRPFVCMVMKSGHVNTLLPNNTRANSGNRGTH